MLLKKCIRNAGNFGQISRISNSVRDKEKFIETEKINSWQIHSYGELDELQFTKSRPPIIRKPNEVVVQISASSVNPIDVAMVGGYGSVLLNFLRQAEACSLQTSVEFPLTLGRDFAGTVIRKGLSVKNDLQIGDEVWGVVPPHHQGCHAEQVVVSECYLSKKPTNISMLEAGGILYAAVTAWSALKISGDLSIFPAKGKNVLVLGGSGGVGTVAVQLLKSWGTNVVATCNTDAVSLLESLAVPVVIDYTKENAFQNIAKEGKYDIILDCAGMGQEHASKYSQFLKEYSLAKYITLKSPLLKNVDQYGSVAGMCKNAVDFLHSNCGLLSKLSTVRWGFFFPSEAAIKEITKKVEEGQIVPCINKIYPFNEVPEAYQRVQAGHLRGKIVIDVTTTNDD